MLEEDSHPAPYSGKAESALGSNLARTQVGALRSVAHSLEEPALGLLVVEALSEDLGLVAEALEGVHLVLDHVLQLLAVGWKKDK